MIKGENELTEEKIKLLKQGSKVEFKWHGNKDSFYVGFIEIDKNGTIYFCAEHNYKNGELTDTGEVMKYYNTLDSFFFFNHFKIIDC